MAAKPPLRLRPGLIILSQVVPRLADAHIRMLVSEEPAVLIEGPRGSGKSTVLHAIAREQGVPVVDLDDLPNLRSPHPARGSCPGAWRATEVVVESTAP
ncbi:MAG: hypothetical protein ACREA0_11580, partial [bacterium]